MLKPEQIPTEVNAAIRHALGFDKTFTNIFNEGIAAAINAWPRMREHTIQVPDDTSDDIRYTLKRVGIFLPLSKEPEA